MNTAIDNNTQKSTSAVYPSVDEFAREIGIGRAAAYKGLRDGSIPSRRVGKRFVIPRAAIAQWLAMASAR